MKVKLHSKVSKKNFKKTQAITEGIMPFTETPSLSNYRNNEEPANNNMNATDLFSLFTADIIKEEIVFTR